MRHRLSLGRWGPRRTWHRPRGQSLVELALLLPVMMLLFAGALDLGRIFYSQITIENAAKEGALEAARNPDSFQYNQDCDVVNNRVMCLVLNEAKGSLYEITKGDVTLTCSPSPCPASPSLGDTVTITVAGRFTLLTPVLAQILGPTMTLSASSVAQLGVVPDPSTAWTSTTTTSTTTSTASTTTTTTTTSTETTTVSTTTTPNCGTPVVPSPTVVASPASGRSESPGPATLFTFTAPAPTPQAGCSFLYSWGFGDGLFAAGTTATHKYLNAGNGSTKEYTVTLVISSSPVPLLPPVPPPWSGSVKVRVNP